MDSRSQSSFYHELNQSRFLSEENHNRPLFELNDVDVAYNSTIVLTKLIFKLYRGDFYFLTGHNGAGKSTFLKLLGAELPHCAGKLSSHLTIGKRALFVSKIFQDLKLIDELSVGENINISYDPNIYDSYTQYQKELKEYCRVFAVDPYLKTRLSQVSGGVLQKIAIIRALMSKPDILLADEPTSNLDKESSAKLFEILNFHCVKRKMAVIWATHNRDFAKNFSGKHVRLEKGKLIYTGGKCFT